MHTQRESNPRCREKKNSSFLRLAKCERSNALMFKERERERESTRMPSGRFWFVTCDLLISLENEMLVLIKLENKC